MRRIKFLTGEYYHVYNRGVEKRDVFLDRTDHFRFLSEMKIMNTAGKCLNEATSQLKEKRLVSIVAYCLMPNHFHLLLKQVEEGGISKFMHKITTGYTMYFNVKYKRSGVLFQGPFKAKYIENDSYMLHLSRYIHLNPADIQEFNGENKIKDLKEYEWSSLPFYLDQDKPCMINLEKDGILSQFEDLSRFEHFVSEASDLRLDIFEYLKIDSD